MREPDEVELPDEVRDPFRASPYAVPMSTLIGGAYVGIADQVQLQPATPSHGSGSSVGSADDGD